jgi:hypothetical protein
MSRGVGRVDDATLHRLRNDLNVIAVGVMLLKQELGPSTSPAAVDALQRLEQALARATAMVAINHAQPRE